MPSNPFALSVLERNPGLGWISLSWHDKFGMKDLVSIPSAVSPSKDVSL